MEGGPKSLNAGLKFDDEGKDGEGTEEPGWTEYVHINPKHWRDHININSLSINSIKKQKKVRTWWGVVGASWGRSYGFITHGDIRWQLPVWRTTSFGHVKSLLIQL